MRTTTDELPTGNPYTGIADLVVEPRLTSATTWYLFSDPSNDGLIIAYLGGRNFPIIET